MTAKRIIYLSCKCAGVSVDEVLSPSRASKLFDLRCIITALLRRQGLYITQIAKLLNRTYPTVIHALRVFDTRCRLYGDYRDRADTIIAYVNSFKK